MIKCIFGVLKKRFKVTLLAQEYPFAAQAQIIPAIAVLHNFIVIHDPSEVSLEDDETELNSVDDAWSMNQAAVSHDERTRAAECRDNIAKAMWDDFTARQTHRHKWWQNCYYSPLYYTETSGINSMVHSMRVMWGR